jgi:hypothetical protein
MSWATFYQELAGVGRVCADRLIAGSVSEEGVEVDGKKIPLTSENRKRVMAAVESLHGKARSKSSADTIRRRVDAMLADLKTMEPTGSERQTSIGALDEGARKLGWRMS